MTDRWREEHVPLKWFQFPLQHIPTSQTWVFQQRPAVGPLPAQWGFRALHPGIFWEYLAVPGLHYFKKKSFPKSRNVVVQWGDIIIKVESGGRKKVWPDTFLSRWVLFPLPTQRLKDNSGKKNLNTHIFRPGWLSNWESKHYIAPHRGRLKMWKKLFSSIHLVIIL